MNNLNYKRLSVHELSERVSNMRPNESFVFWEEIGEDGGSGAYGVKCLELFDAILIVICYYGGGYPTVLDITCHDNSVVGEIESYLYGTGLEDGVYVLERNRSFPRELPVQTEFFTIDYPESTYHNLIVMAQKYKEDGTCRVKFLYHDDLFGVPEETVLPVNCLRQAVLLPFEGFACKTGYISSIYGKDEEQAHVIANRFASDEDVAWSEDWMIENVQPQEPHKKTTEENHEIQNGL